MRSRKDGTPPRPPRKRTLTELFIRKVRPEAIPFKVWDEKQRGLVLQVAPSGHRSWHVFYRHHASPCWFFVGNASSIGLADARRIAARVALQVAEGRDPTAERRAERSQGTFAELALAYRERYAKKYNKSWKQAAALTDRYLLPKWGRLQAKSILRSDVRSLIDKITAPVLANQVLAAASALFSWAIKNDLIDTNPCKLVDRNPTKSRERILADSEIPLFWKEFDTAGLVRCCALRFLLIVGQRSGEVAHMRREHIIDGWWTMPGAPDPKSGWPGTKNGQAHRVWLSAPARQIIVELQDEATSGFVFHGLRKAPVKGLDEAMRSICQKLNVERAVPHDLRRTFSSKVTALGFGRDAMNRVTNHKEGRIASIYDRFSYADENKTIMERVAAHLMGLVEGRPVDEKVILFERNVAT